MKKLGKLEKKVFAYLNRHVPSVANKQTALRILRTDFGFTPEEVLHLYTLWYYSHERDLDEFEYDEEGLLVKFINTLITLDKDGIDKFTDDLYDSGMLDKLLGPDFNANCGNWSSTVPCISFKTDGIQLELDRETWEQYFSGLGDDEIWMYTQSFGNYSYPEEVDSEEFEYVYTDDETIEHLKTLAIMAGKNNWPGKDGKVRNNEVNEFLSKILPSEEYEDIVNDWLSSFEHELARSREEAVRHCYKEQVTYDTSNTRCETGDECIFIPYEDLETMVVGESLINLSDLKENQVVNNDVYLSDCWYDTWIDEDGREECTRDLNLSLDRVIEKLYEEEDLEELLREREKMINMLEKAGFVKQFSTSTGAYYKSKDGKIELHTDNINYKDKKIRFTYEGKPHLIPIEEFPNWIYGTPLDLNENVRVNKKLLKEQTEDINKISIFDFDGTLMKTPNSIEGKKQWEEFYGKDYPHKGWWGKPESLDDAVFDIQPIESTVSDYKKEINNPNTFVIMLTGRIPHQSSQIEELLALHNIYFKEYHYKSDGDTLTSKLNTIKSLLNRFPQVNEIEMWEDREAHVIAFEEWGKENGINIKVNYITDDIVPLNESTESIDSYYEDSYAGVLDRRKPFNESVEDKLYNKMVGMLKKPPYGDLLLKMGLDKDGMEQVFKKMFGNDITLRFVGPNDHDEVNVDYYIYVRNGNRDLIYSEYGFVDKSKKTSWQLFDHSDSKKYKDSDGRKRIVVDILGKTELIYDTDLNNWEEAPISIKKDKFFTESTKESVIPPYWEEVKYPNEGDKFQKYHKKLSNIIKPPYFIDLKRLGIDFKDWKPILSIIFDRDIILDGVSKTDNRILDAETGVEIYDESVYDDLGWAFYNRITGEYKSTLP